MPKNEDSLREYGASDRYKRSVVSLSARPRRSSLEGGDVSGRNSITVSTARARDSGRELLEEA